MRRLVVLLVVALAACGDDGPSRQDVMAAVAAEYAVPAYERFAQSAGGVQETVTAACADPTSGEQAVAAIDAARAEWLAAQAVWTGPVMDRRSTGLVDWPVDPAGIDALVAENDELTPAFIAEQVGADSRGLRALRSVLSRSDAAELVTDERWCAYLVSTATVVADEGAALVTEWSTFREEFAGEDVNDWLAMLVNDALQAVKATTATPPEVEEGSIVSVAADRSDQLQGVLSAMTGLGPPLDAELRERLQQALEAAIAAYESGDLEQGRTLATEVERLITADVAGQLSVTIGFSDADGDGSG